MSIKNYSQQWITDEDISVVSTALHSPFLTGGPSVKLFEEKLAEYVCAKHCTAFNSATSALHTACIALGINEKSLVWTSSISFVASANCAKYCGAKVDFVDIDPATYVVSVSKLKTKLENAKKENKLPDLLIVVHLGGLSADMKAIKELSTIYGFRIIEDASHALSALYKDRKVGSCEYSDMCIFSFHPVKIITTLEGGVVTTNKIDLNKKVKLLSSHHTEPCKNAFSEPWEYQQTGLGYNFRLNDVQASLGISQLKRIEAFKNKRLDLAYEYSKTLDQSKILLQKITKLEMSSFHLFIVNLTGTDVVKRRRKLFHGLLNCGYKTNVHYIPIHTQPYYAEQMDYSGLTHSENYYACALSLPIYPDLEKTDVHKVCDIVNNI